MEFLARLLVDVKRRACGAAREGLDLAFDVAGQEVVFEENAVLEGLVPAFDLALGLGMEQSAAHVWTRIRPTVIIPSPCRPEEDARGQQIDGVEYPGTLRTCWRCRLNNVLCSEIHELAGCQGRCRSSSSNQLK